MFWDKWMIWNSDKADITPLITQSVSQQGASEIGKAFSKISVWCTSVYEVGYSINWI